MNLWQVDIDFRYIQVLLLKKLPPPGFEPGSLDQELDALPTELTWLVGSVASLRHWDSFYQIPSYIFLQIVARFYGVENEGRTY